MAKKKTIAVGEPVPFTYNNHILAKALHERNFDVLDELIRIYREGTLTDRERVSMLEKLLPFLLPKLASTEIRGEGLPNNIIQVIYKNKDIENKEE